MIDAVGTIFAFMSNKDVWEQYRAFINTDVFTNVHEKLLNSINGFYAHHIQAKSMSADEFEVYFFSRGGGKGMSIADSVASRKFFSRIRNGLTGPILTDLITSWKETRGFARIQDVLNGRQPKGMSIAEFLTQEAELLDDSPHGQAKSEGLSLGMLATTSSGGQGYEWGVDLLNISLGPVRRGDFIVIGGRPGLGKTAFTLFNVLKWVAGHGLTCLFVNNEENKAKIGSRVVQIMCNKGPKWVAANQQDAILTCVKLGVNKNTFRHFQAHNLGMHAIGREVQAVNPEIVVINQLHKVPTGENKSSSAERLERLGMWCRSMAADDRIVIAILQADVSADFKRKVFSSQLYASKTAIQGEADAIICIGAEQPGDVLRGINIPKNSLLGGPRTIGTSKYAYIEVDFNADTGHWK